MTNGGKRPGAGRKPGSLNQKTIIEQMEADELRERVKKVSSMLITNQIGLAAGQTFLYKIRKVVEKNDEGKVTKITKLKPELVVDQREIEEYLGGLVENGNLDDEKATFYFLTTKEPDSHAINTLLDRAYGRAPQESKIDLTTKGESLNKIYNDKQIESIARRAIPLRESKGKK